jgi:hypothetical protein
VNTPTPAEFLQGRGSPPLENIVFRPVPALLLLAATVSTASALEISDNDTKFAFTFFSRAVAAKATATQANGDSYNATEGINGRGDDLDLYMRWVRVGFKGTYKGYLYQVVLNANDLGRSSTPTVAANVSVWDAYVGKSFKSGDVTHLVTFGKQNTWANTVVSRAGSQMLATSRATGEYLNTNGVGLGYRLTAPVISLGLDVQNNVGDETTNQNPTGTGSTGTTNRGEGMYYAARLELTGPSEDAWAIGKWQESFAGKAGKGIALGIDAGANQRDRIDAHTPTTPNGTQAASQQIVVFGADLLLHVDGLTALAEYRHQARKVTADVNTATVKDDSVGSEAIVLQAGYAFPVEGYGVLEPAVRYQKIDNDTANDYEGKSFGAKDYADSGKQIDFGLNLYIAGHNNKLGFIYTKWTGEELEGKDAATADIVRLQHQLMF